MPLPATRYESSVRALAGGVNEVRTYYSNDSQDRENSDTQSVFPDSPDAVGLMCK